MPDKNYKKRCGKSCYRCWINKLNHANKLKKKNFPKMFEFDENESIKPIIYNSNMEEFIDKYVICVYNHENIQKIDNNYFDTDYKEYNKDIISKITFLYNHWLNKEKGITKKVKEKDVLKLIKNSDLLKIHYYKDYLLIDCNYI